MAKITQTKEETLKETEKKIKELDRKMVAVQKSTRTSLPQLNKLHNYFRMRFGWYYRWQLNPYSNQAHTVIIPDLKPNASYQYRIAAKDAAGNTSKGEELNLITPPKEKSLLQLVVKSLEETFSWTRKLKDAPYIKRFRRK